jgi:hypothetical protein
MGAMRKVIDLVWFQDNGMGEFPQREINLMKSRKNIKIKSWETLEWAYLPLPDYNNFPDSIGEFSALGGRWN